MAMSIPTGGSGDPIVDMNTTPLIDVPTSEQSMTMSQECSAWRSVVECNG